jgi:ferredoxin
MSSVPDDTLGAGATVMVGVDGLDAIIAELRNRGHRVIGPRFDHGAIVHGDIASTADLPRGRRDVQAPGTYKVEERSDGALFGFSAGVHAWKPFLHPAVVTLWTARREGPCVSIENAAASVPRLALFGVRPCDLAALKILDRVLLQRIVADEDYRRRRDGLFVVAANCTDPVSTCFCTSMGTGPHARAGFDLALTEILRGGAPRFAVEIGTREGAAVMSSVSSQAVRQEERDALREAHERAASAIGRRLETDGLAEWLTANPDHPNWHAAAERCLTCGNCTAVCPTCFCTTVRDITSLTGEGSERQRLWDSCFTSEFSYIHGGAIRQSATARLRHRVTHKLGTWHAQFGTTGCVGCGRCSTWCPAAIDMTTEICMMRDAVARAPEGDYANA